jgi:hypothetical protein
MPGTADLPDDLHKLARLQALELDFRRFDADAGELVRVIGGILKPRPKSTYLTIRQAFLGGSVGRLDSISFRLALELAD